MRRFEVLQMQDDLWSVVDQGRVLYWYPTEQEAREAALALASSSCQSGRQAAVVICAGLNSPHRPQRFTGM